MRSFKSCNLKYIQLSVFIAATLFSQVISATQLGTQFTDTAGSTVIISLDPPLPRRGESFTIEISGTWRCPSITRLGNLDVDLDDFDSVNQRIWIVGSSTYVRCEDEYEPTPFSKSAVFPSSAWEHIDEKQQLKVHLRLVSQLISVHDWLREFDLIWGLHEIPPQIGSGHWISDQRPFQGINVEQQGDTVLLYKLAYDTNDGEPRWLMGNAGFHGDVTHGVTHYVSWLNPSRDQPKEDEMSFTKGSFGIEVAGVNQIYVNFAANYRAETYKRYVFRLADNQLPVVVPDMAGRWNLYAFDNQNLEASYLIEFRAATKSERGLWWYRFNSIDDQWVLECWVNLDGVGICDLTNEDLGITMSYNLLDFNGNYAKAPVLTSNPEETSQTGILLRDGFHLPVLDFQ
ncbi:MAG: hypothetical protein QNK19_04055 [Xanthomonadales bacterium]|nr:hypothetical protein [Xanthomonadales bacterium]